MDKKLYTPAWRNVYYDGKSGEIVLWTWDVYGNKICERESFYPYVFIAHEQGTDGIGIGPGIENAHLIKKTFKNSFERFQFIENHISGNIFYNLPPEQQFLIDRFGNQDLSNPPPIDIAWIDIETWSPDEFPEPSEANHVINLITVWRKDQFITWALPRNKNQTYSPEKNSNIIYKSFSTERDLLEDFINWWVEDYPDVVAGWNTLGFDFPYLFNRMKKIFGEKYIQKLSPVGKMFFMEKGMVDENFSTKISQGKFFNKDLSRWFIKGVQLLDYMDIYKTFNFIPRESYSLDHISEVELGQNKIKFETSNLSEIATKDWQLYVEYNIQDVRLLRELDKKLRFIDTVRMISYMGFISFEKALGKVSPITGALANEARKKGKYIATFKKEKGGHDDSSYIGGYVKEPVRGLIPSVVVYDANSLYPNTMITLNISPETKIGKIIEENEDGSVKVRFDSQNIIRLFSKETFNQFLQKTETARSAAGVLYSQKIKGIIPEFLDRLYNQRVQIQNEMKQTTDPIKKEALNLLQIAVKIFLNSIYGAMGQKSFCFFDIDHSVSVTLSGQETIKKAAAIAHQFIEQKTGKQLDQEKTIIYGDTDSIHVSLQSLFPEGLFIEQKDQKNNVKQKIPAPGVIEFLKELNKELDCKLDIWAREFFNSHDPRFKMKQETVCDRALYIEKKHYILRSQDIQDFKKIDKYKYVGVEISKGSYAKSVRNIIEKLVKALFEVGYNLSTNDLDNLVHQSYQDFKQLPIIDLAIRVSISNLKKYEQLMKGWKVGLHTPVHVKGALYYNKLLEEMKLQSKYEPIKSGMKIKMCYLNVNPKKIDVIAFPSIYPKEFIEAHYIPHIEKMYMKTIFPALERFFSVTGHKLIDPTKLTTIDLFQFCT